MHTVYLKDTIEAVKSESAKRGYFGRPFTSEQVDEAIQKYIEKGLRYNCAKGKQFINPSNCISEYCEVKDIPVYIDANEAALWEFTGRIRSEAGRIAAGYKD